MAPIIVIHHPYEADVAARLSAFLGRRGYRVESLCLGVDNPNAVPFGAEVVLLWSGAAQDLWMDETLRPATGGSRIVAAALDDAAAPLDPSLNVKRMVDARVRGDAILAHGFVAIHAALTTRPAPPRAPLWRRPAALMALATAIGGLAWLGSFFWPNPPARATAQAPATIEAGGPEPVEAPAADGFQVIRDCRTCPELVIIPAGRAVLGDTTQRGEAQERPARLVAFDYPLAVGRFEVTFGEWDACVAERGCAYRPDDLGWGRGRQPVIGVSFEDAQAYVQWLSRRTGHGYRLPSEAEWEYAARAGAVGDFSFGGDEAGLCAFGNGADAQSAYPLRNLLCQDGYADRTAPVGAFQPNGFGLFDTTGNVWEWVQDCWHPSYEGAPASGAPWVRGCFSDDRVLRGGGFTAKAHDLRSAARTRFAPTMRMPDVGFRVVRPVAAEAP